MVTNSNFGSSRERPINSESRPVERAAKPSEVSFLWIAKSLASAVREQLTLIKAGYPDQATTVYNGRAAVYMDLARRNPPATELLTKMVADDIRAKRPVNQLELIRRVLAGDVKDLRNIDPAAYKPEPMPVAKKQTSA